MTYSRPERTTIGPKCLTAVFGMGTGVATWVNSPASCIERSREIIEFIAIWWGMKPQIEDVLSDSVS